jgi:two-component system, LytTR family, response regulator
MIRAILVDDEPASLEALALKIQKISSDIEIVNKFHDAAEASLFLEHHIVDIVFLDIEMPEIDGFTFLEKFPERSFEVIITTAHHQYAINAVRQSVLDFLLKPVNMADLSKALDRLKLKLQAKTKSQSSQKVNAIYDKLPVPSMRGLVFIPVAEILYLQSEGNYTTIFTQNQQDVVSSKNLGDYEELLGQLHFLRIHHSCIINLGKIREYVRGEGGSVILNNGKELPVSKRKKQQLLDLIG